MAANTKMYCSVCEQESLVERINGEPHCIHCKQEIGTKSPLQKDNPRRELLTGTADLLDNKRTRYGDPAPGHANVGLIWTALLQNHYGIELSAPIPADLVLLMLAGTKLNRAAIPGTIQDDDYIDGIGYQALAFQVRKENK